jgi:MFS family permease
MQAKRATLWRHPDFLELWIGQTISEVGSRISRDGLPLTAVLVLGASPAQMGVLLAIGTSATLLFGLGVGVLVDRLRRRPVLIAADLGRALVLGWVPLAFVMKILSLPQLYAVAALTGVLTVFFDVAYQSYLPTLVERTHVLEGNRKLGLSSSTAEIVGPGLTGVLIQLITAPVAILFDAISYLFSAGSVALIRKPEPAPKPRADVHVWTEIRAGGRFLAQHPLLRALGRRSATYYFFNGFVASLYSLYAIRELHMRPAVLGLAIAVGGVGNLIGALVSERVVRRFGLGPTFVVTSLVIGVAFLLIPLAGVLSRFSIALMMTSQLVGDMAWSIYNIHELSLRQSVTPDHVLGRVNAAMQLLTRGVFPAGAILGGVLGAAIGLRGTLTVAGLGILFSSVWLMVSPVRTLREQPAPVTI